MPGIAAGHSDLRLVWVVASNGDVVATLNGRLPDDEDLPDSDDAQDEDLVFDDVQDAEIEQ